MISAALREKMFRYLDKEIDLAQLEEWLVPQEPILLADPETVDAGIVAVIELALVDIPAGSQTEYDLREALNAVLVENSTVIIDYPSDQTTHSSSSNRPVEGTPQTIVVGNPPIITMSVNLVTPG